MKLCSRGLPLAIAVLASLIFAQDPGRSPLNIPAPAAQNDESPRYGTLPSGKSQRDEILRAERRQNIRDAARLVALSRQLQLELEGNSRYVLSISSLKKTDEIEKLAKRIGARMRHN